MEMERDLVKHVDKPYRDTSKQIINKIEKVFSKFEHHPEAIRYHLIKQELSKERVFHQISRRYAVVGKGFSDFLRGSLQDNFKKAVAQANITMKSVRSQSEAFELHYQEQNDIESDWRRRTLKHGQNVNNIITQGIAKHDSVDTITDNLVKETDMQVYEAKRLARTESMRVINSASLLTFKGLGVKKVKWLDSTEQVQLRNKKGNKKGTNVCDYCKGYATGGKEGKGIYPINALPSKIPAHPNCRCTLAPVIDKTKN